MSQPCTAPRVDLFGVPVQAQTYAEAVACLRAWAADPAGRRFVSLCTVYLLMRAQEDARILNALQFAAMVTADGMPLVWMQRARGLSQVERIYGPDLLLALLDAAQIDGTRHLLLGHPAVLDDLRAALLRRFPQAQIATLPLPMLPELDFAVDPALVEQINQHAVDVLWIGLGAPKQDLFMARYRAQLDAPLMIGVGAAFDLLSGQRRQAPRWMREHGLEWLFRWAQEPRRLTKRYLYYNLRFLLRLLRSP